MRILPIGEPELQKMKGDGFRRGTLQQRLFPGLPADVETLDYSGFILYTREDTPEGPMYIPLHRAAEGYWKEQGYL
jgi:TRAP-type uncharacterized transport system substrate-binding protein